MSQESINAVVIDIGSNIIKVGFSGENLPTSCVPSTIGTPKSESEAKEIIVGEEAQDKKTLLNLSYPIQNGVITSWEHLEKILHYCYANHLRVQPKDHPVLLAIDPLTPKGDREKMVQMMFDIFNVPSLYIAPSAVLSLYASGRTSGIVLESGDGVTRAVPIYKGYALHDCIMGTNFAGKDLTDYMIKLLDEVGAGSSVDTETARDIKEKLCYVSLDFENELKNPSKKEVNYKLPNGETLTLADQHFRCAEALFQPKKSGTNFLGTYGIHELVFLSVMKCDAGIRKDLFSNIVVSGGNAMFEGISERLTKEVSALASSDMKVKVSAPSSKKLSAWMGGSILSGMSSFQGMWITKSEYEQSGAEIVNKKCL